MFHQVYQVSDFLRSDVDSTAHVSATYFTHNNFFANLFAVVIIGNALTGNFITQLLNSRAFTGGDVGNGLVELWITYPDPHALCHLQLQVFQDQALNGLSAQGFIRRQALIFGCRVCFYFINQCPNFTFQHHTLINNHRHFVKQLGLGHDW